MKKQPAPTSALPLTLRLLAGRDPVVPKANGWHTWREVAQRSAPEQPPATHPKTGIWS